MKKITVYSNAYTFSEFFRTGVSFIFTKLFWRKAKLVRYPVYMHGKKNIEYDAGFNIGFNCRFDLLTENVTLRVGRNCDLGNYTHISALNDVRIGDDFICGDCVYIGDTSHGLYRVVGDEEQSDPSSSPKERPVYAGSVSVGNNVWVGEHSAILPGAKIGNGCVIGANSVVNGVIPDNCIAVGSPARVIKKWNKDTHLWEKVI